MSGFTANGSFCDDVNECKGKSLSQCVFFCCQLDGHDIMEYYPFCAPQQTLQQLVGKMRNASIQWEATPARAIQATDRLEATASLMMNAKVQTTAAILMLRATIQLQALSVNAIVGLLEMAASVRI